MKPRFLILIAALIVVVSMTAWRLANPMQRDAVTLVPEQMQPAPGFQLLDQHNRPVQLAGYVNRYRVLLAFFDGQKGLDADPLMLQLREYHPALKRAGVVVLGISTPMSGTNKEAAAVWPFPILRDTNAGQPDSCCSIWGCAGTLKKGEVMPQIRSALFFIRQDGLVPWDGQGPKPIEQPESAVRRILSGELL